MFTREFWEKNHYYEYHGPEYYNTRQCAEERAAYIGGSFKKADGVWVVTKPRKPYRV